MLLADNGQTVNGDGIHQCITAMMSAAEACVKLGQTFRAVEIAGGVIRWQMNVMDEQDLIRMERSILETAFASGQNDGSLQFTEENAELTAAHVVIFSPQPQIDAISFVQRRPVTLVLPPSAVYTDVIPEIRIVTLTEEQPLLVW